MLDPSSYDPAPRQNAVQAFDEMRNYARPAVPALIHLIATDDSDGRASEREAQVAALVHIDGADAIAELARVINGDLDEEGRIAAVTALGGLGSSRGRAIFALASALNNDTEAVRQAASQSLGKLGRRAVPALTAALKSPYLYQRAYALQALSRIIPLPHAAAHAITLALRDKSDIIRAEAAAALRGNRVDASEAISDQQTDEDSDIDEPQTTGQSQNLEAFVAGNTAKDTRIYSKAEIIAAIAPDKNLIDAQA